MDEETIVAVEPAGTRCPDLDLGNVAILPGLVNAHCHLDLTAMRGLAPPCLPLPDWLRQVVGHRRTQSAEQVAAAVRDGLAECIRTGTTLIGDVSGDGGSWDVLATSPIRAVVFRELLGLPTDRADAAAEVARRWLTERRSTTTCRAGLSPHAPYSVRADLLARAAELSRRHAAPLAVHLAESLDELDLLSRQSGPFVAFLQSLGVWDADGLVRSLEEVPQLCENVAFPLFIHGNHLPPSTPLPRGSTLVYCPRTHAAFGHPPHPFRRFLDRGIRVALGTDGLSSNPDLDLLAEARFLYQRTDLSAETVLRMATIAGAEALGFADRTGSLTPGKSADLIVVPLDSQVSRAEDADPLAASPYDLILASNLPVSRVMCRGRWVNFGL